MRRPEQSFDRDLAYAAARRMAGNAVNVRVHAPNVTTFQAAHVAEMTQMIQNGGLQHTAVTDLRDANGTHHFFYDISAYDGNDVFPS